MSYEIVYNRAFIKTTRGIIPLILTGSNNCYEYTFRGRERREREWSVFYGNKHIEIDEQDLLTFISDNAKNNDYEFCMFRGKWVYYKDAYDFYKQGIKNAHTIEDYIEYGRQNKRWRLGDLRCFVSDWSKGYDKHFNTLEKHISTTADLEAWIDEAKKYIGTKDNIYMCFKWLSNEPITYKEPKILKGKVIIAYTPRKSVYISGLYALTSCKKEALVFDNQAVAEAYCKENNYNTELYKIIKYNPHEKNYKNYVISLGHGAYIYRKTRYGFRYIYSKKDAQRMEKKKALSLIEHLTQRFKEKGYTFVMEEAI